MEYFPIRLRTGRDRPPVCRALNLCTQTLDLAASSGIILPFQGVPLRVNLSLLLTGRRLNTWGGLRFLGDLAQGPLGPWS